MTFLLFLYGLLLCVDNIIAIEYSGRHTFGSQKSFVLEWSVLGESLHVKITAKTPGWFGFGIAPQHQSIHFVCLNH